MLKKLFYKLLVPLPFGILMALLIWFIASLNLFNLAENSRNLTLDLLNQLFPYEQAFQSYADQMVFIDIDDASLNQVGQWPWPRQTIAEILKKINQQSPLVVGMDILFAERDRYAAENISKFFNINEKELIGIGIKDGDMALSNLVANNPYVLAISALDKEQLIKKDQADISGKFVIVNHANQFIYQADNLLAPIKELEPAFGFGFVNTIKTEGLIRKTPLVFNIKDEVYPSLNLDMIRVAQGSPNHIMKFNEIGDKLEIKSGEVITQADIDGTFTFHYGHMNRFEKISMLDVINDKADLQEKIIIIGSSAAGLGDYHATSIEQDVPGPLFHLQVIDQILGKRFINFHPAYDQIVYFLAFLFSIVLCWVVVKAPLFIILFLVPLSLAPLYFLAKYSFLGFGVVVNFPISIAIFFISGLMTYFVKTFIQSIEKRKIQSSFLQYVPAEIVKNISKESDVPSLGGQEIECSVFFLDIRGFTTITETLKHDPNLLVKVIGHIMNRVTEILIKHEATIDKYIGDAVMAFWNAPVRIENHQLKAYQAAKEIEKTIPIINTEIKSMLPQNKKKLIEVNFGMGISTGNVVVGNMGSEFRFNYSVMGDMVNVAARLEAMTKEKKKRILVGATNLNKAMIKNYQNEKVILKFIDNIKVRGKKESIPVYAVE